MVASYKIVVDLELFRSRIDLARGHPCVVQSELKDILACIAQLSSETRNLDAGLASGILATVDILLRENDVGRRPWTLEWEDYFGKCMENAARLLHKLTFFENYRVFCPPGYCNRFLDAFVRMDYYNQENKTRYSHWSQHFARLASCAAQMFSFFADKEARIEEELLEHQDNAVFTCLLTGYAKSATL